MKTDRSGHPATLSPKGKVAGFNGRFPAASVGYLPQSCFDQALVHSRSRALMSSLNYIHSSAADRTILLQVFYKFMTYVWAWRCIV